ncbi:MAG: virulence factor MviN [Friedmanniella sp.]|nr:virulence factor MviN [Friedmanniella sp.]
MRGRGGSVALTLAVLTLASRVLGFGRSLVFSKTVGDTCLGDVYNAANSLPNVLFEIVAGGVLAGVVIPVVARHAGAGRRTEAGETVSALLTWTLVALTPAGLVALLGAPLYAAAFAKVDCVGSATTLAALLVTFAPQVWLYGLAVVSAGVLQAHQRFLAAALAPLLSSVVVIVAYLLFAVVSGPASTADLTGMTAASLAALGWGTTLGVLALAVCTLVPLRRLRLRLRPRWRFAEGDRAVVTRIAAAGLVGLALQQLSVLLTSWVAQHTGDEGALTRFTWANAIYLLPYAVLTAPLLQLVFPRLAAAAEQGRDQVRAVLAETGPAVVVLAWLGAALLVATAVPVARVFVLGPGSGRTSSLALPVALFAPAVVGFSLLGLASRTLLAQHEARRSGLTTAAAWAGVILAVAAARLGLPSGWVVPGMAAAVSLGMVVGAVVGWVLVRRTTGPGVGASLVPALLVGPLAAALAAVGGGAVARLTAQSGLVGAALGALSVAVLCTVIFAGVLRLVRPALLRQVLALRSRPVPSTRSARAEPPPR